MKIACIADIHNDLSFLKELLLIDYDVLVIAGDLTNFGGSKEVKHVLNALDDNKPTIFIAGNHDRSLGEEKMKKWLVSKPNLHYLQNDYFELEGVIFYGMPQTLRFKNWYFMLDKDKDFEQYLPTKRVDIFLGHQPPSRCGLDVVESALGEIETGSEVVRSFLETSKVKYYITGHIHEYAGKSAMLSNTKIINVSNTIRIIKI